MTASFSFMETDIPGLKVITPFYAEDERGYFLKYFVDDIFKENGIDFTVSECFETWSNQYVLRGLHFQTQNPQAKLVRAISGEIWDVAVDLRSGSPTFLQWRAYTLSSENKKMFYIPPGFAHGFFVVSRQALVGYQCAGAYNKETDGGILWNDSNVGIAWPIPEGILPIISQRDRNLPLYASLNSDYLKLRFGDKYEK